MARGKVASGRKLSSLTSASASTRPRQMTVLEDRSSYRPTSVACRHPARPAAGLHRNKVGPILRDQEVAGVTPPKPRTDAFNRCARNRGFPVMHNSYFTRKAINSRERKSF